MKRSETAVLLGVIQVFDHRTIGDGDVIAWAEVLGDLPFGDCLEAVRDHYRESTAWLMPAHVVERVRIKHRRAAEIRHAESLRLPPLDHERSHSAYIEARKVAIMDGEVTR